MIAATKRCARCGEIKPRGAFGRAPRMSCGLQSYCRQCHNSLSRARAAERYRAKAEWLAKLKDVPCADCGGRFPPECMDLDHVRGGKLFPVGKNLANFGLDRLASEAAKCDVVCANCHRIRTKVRRGSREEEVA